MDLYLIGPKNEYQYCTVYSWWNHHLNGLVNQLLEKCIKDTIEHIH